MAVVQGAHDIITMLLENGADVNAPAHSSEGLSALQAAALRGDPYMVQTLIIAGADINAEPARRYGKTALQAAASTGDWEVVQMLIIAGADINAEPARTYGRTALQAAAESGYTELVRWFIDLGADVNAAPAKEHGLCVFEAAVQNGSAELVQLLLASNIDLQVQSGPAIARAIYDGKFDTLGSLLSSGIDINATCTTWSSVWSYVSTMEIALLENPRLETPEDRLAMIKLLLSHGANDKSRALIRAVAYGYHEIVELLWSSGADVNYANPDLWDSTALGEAANARDLGMVRFLLDHGAHAGSKELQEAALGGDIDVVQLLISERADINAAPFLNRFFRRRTALQTAAETGNLELVRLLLDAGALPDIDPSPYEEATALQFAAIRGYIDVVYELLQQGADVNAAARGIKGRTVLESAAEHGRLDIVQLLLNVQAEVRGTRALEFARQEGHDGVVQLLSEHLAKD